MIEILEGFPDSVVAITAKGRVTKKDYDDILIPKVEETLRRHDKVRCYYELGGQFSGMDPGALWEDFKIGIGYLSRWEKVAVVTDVDWVQHTVNAFRFLMPGQIRVFSTSKATDARAWITAA
jgi:hypothetical protein